MYLFSDGVVLVLIIVDQLSYFSCLCLWYHHVCSCLLSVAVVLASLLSCLLGSVVIVVCVDADVGIRFW